MTALELPCSVVSAAAGELLPGTATQGTDWLLVEIRGAWGRDAVVDSGLPPLIREWLERFEGKVILIRRPDRRSGVAVLRATVSEAGGRLTRQELHELDDLPAVDLEAGAPSSEPVVLVCAHGRRDACCARVGVQLFDALASRVAPDRLWQASHLGGHRFAPNVLVLPYGIQLGRIPVERAAAVVDLLSEGRIPLDLYRGRTLYPAAVQAAEHAVRLATGYDGVGELQLVAEAGGSVTFATPTGKVVARVEEGRGPLIPASCGAEPESTTAWIASIESGA